MRGNVFPKTLGIYKIFLNNESVCHFMVVQLFKFSTEAILFCFDQKIIRKLKSGRMFCNLGIKINFDFVDFVLIMDNN